MPYFKNLFIPFILFLTCCFWIPQVSATHFMGVDMFYECLPNSNNCVFRIYHTTYYDCGGAATVPFPGIPFPPSFKPFQPDTCIQPTLIGGAMTFVSYTEITPICPQAVSQCTSSTAVINGVLEGTFYADYDFCSANCNTYNIVWASCCRNGVLPPGSANDGIYSGATQINLGLTSCNSSPYFVHTAPTYICARVGAIIDHHAIDPDGDSLVYRIVACQDDSVSAIGYSTGFSPTQPLGPSWQISLDSVTGVLSILPNPGNIITAPICIMAEEYRNGVNIGSIVRDIQLTAFNCSSVNYLPQLDSAELVSGGIKMDSLTFEICVNDTLELNIYFTDQNTSQVISLDTTNLMSGLQVTNTVGNPLVTAVQFAQTQPGIYAIPFSFVDDNCPVLGSNVKYVYVEVTPNCITSVITYAPCGQAVGAIDITITGPNSPFSFSWSTGDTTEDVNGLLPGSYTVTVTNTTGFMQTRTVFVRAISINLNATLTDPDCNNVMGSITTNVTGGIAPFTYLWSTGATTASISNLSAGGYRITMTDVNGCSKHMVFILDPPDSCFNIVEGIVFEDYNGNCLRDAGESPIANKWVNITPGGAVLTDANGYYQYRLSQGNYIIEAQLNSSQQVICPLVGFHGGSFGNLGNVQRNLDFAIQTDFVVELSVHTLSKQVRPGSDASHVMTVTNNGNHAVNGTLSWKHDSVLQYQSASPSPWSYNPLSRTVTWYFFNLAPFQSLSYHVSTYTDSAVSLGTWFLNKATVDPILGDSMPANNVSIFQDTTRGTFDPNGKLVTPRGVGSLGLIEESVERLTYTLHFQNTGTDTAFYVLIRDTLDTHLGPLSFQKLGQSHPYQLTIEDDSILVFQFNQIKLADAVTDSIRSQGFVAFSLEIGGTKAPGTQIRNEAAIYFDFNDPVMTNSTLNTIFAYPEVDHGPDVQICEGEAIQAHITSPGLPPYDFQWSHGVSDLKNTTGVSQVNVTATGRYSVTVTDSLGITVTSVGTNVAVSPLPDASFSFTPVGLRVAFFNTGGIHSSWQWDFGDGDTLVGTFSHIHAYKRGELYTVTLIVTNSCGSDTITQNVDLRGVAIEKTLFGQSVKLVPHPVQDVSYLRFENITGKAFRLRILDLQGRVVKEVGETRGEMFEITRGDLAAGLYMYELIGNQSYIGKMVMK